MFRKISITLILSLLAIINFAIWKNLHKPVKLRSAIEAQFGVTYNPLGKNEDPKDDAFPTHDAMDQDLKLLEGKVNKVRTYDTRTDISDIALNRKMNVLLGAWISGDLERNKKEIEALIETSNKDNLNITGLLVGNEVLLRGDLTEDQLIEYIREVKKHTKRPVSESEDWDRWLQNPSLAEEVDFIAVHLLPFWEGVSVEQAVDFALKHYYEVKKAYPNKPVIITEVGWPSDGKPFRHAVASRANQAKFIRNFIERATQENIEFYLVEAFDQPWKTTIEGSVGAYWGLFDADRNPKYPMSEDRLIFTEWKGWASSAILSSLAIMFVILGRCRKLKLSGIVFLGVIINLAISIAFWSLFIVTQKYQTLLSATFWGIFILMQLFVIVILLVEGLEIAEILWHYKRNRNFQPIIASSGFNFPKVSIHVPIHNEPPDMVRKTLEALARVDYPNFEVLVIDNNTSSPQLWKPVAEDCKRLGSNFRFFHLENWPGFKAGALNYALDQTAIDAEIIAVIDSDYIVSSSWLKSMTPYFENKAVGFVQSPQDYRDRDRNLFKRFCYWEYASFFNIGMVQRNDYNAIIQHGTMTLIRKSALLEVGKWGEWCIVEDTELGLRLYKAGYDSVYCKTSFGHGLMPNTLRDYMTQRYRWVYGAMQILKTYFRSFLPFNKRSSLTVSQRYYFIAGWLPWLSDGLGLVCTIISIILSILLILDPLYTELPVNVFLMPTIGLFSFKMFRTLLLYRICVPCSFWKSLGSILQGLSLTHTVAKAVWWGIFTSDKPFMRTPKYEKQNSLVMGLVSIWQELLLLVLLLFVIFGILTQDHFENLSGRLWLSLLCFQSMPYMATFATMLLSCRPEANFVHTEVS